MAEQGDFRVFGEQYWQRKDLGNGNVKIINGKWNHVFYWYEYADPSENGYDHPKHEELAYIDEDGTEWYHWVYEEDKTSPTGYPRVSGDGANLVAGSGNDDIQNDADNCFITGGGGNDNIGNRGSNVLIDAGEGADTISNFQSDDGTPDNVKIIGGTGNDYIDNRGKKATITGGAGNDTILNWHAR